MKITPNELAGLCRTLDIPDLIYPWLDRFFTDDEIFLMLLVSRNPLNMGEIYEEWAGEKPYRDLAGLHGFLNRCCKRGIISKVDQDRFGPANFHERFDSWAIFEGWVDIPEDIREQLNSWEVDYYIQQHIDQINTLKRGEYRDPALTWPEYVLLPEAMALIDRADHVYLWPCNCRSMMGSCAKNVYTCLRFSNHRDVGWEISTERAHDIVLKSNKDGLMQNAEISLNPDGSFSGAICNCCSDCCFPHQLAEKRDAAKLWPLTRYVAEHLVEHCIGCGSCVK